MSKTQGVIKYKFNLADISVQLHLHEIKFRLVTLCSTRAGHRKSEGTIYKSVKVIQVG